MLCVPVFVEPDFLCGVFFAIAEKARKMMYRAEGTYPAAEEPSEYYRQHDRCHCPQERPVKLMGGQYGAEGDEGVELDEPVDGPAPQLPEIFAYGTDYAEPQKQ